MRSLLHEPLPEKKNGLRGFRHGLTQTDLYSLRRKNLEILVDVEEEFYYSSSENKGADHSYLCLCFRIGKNTVFS